LIEHGIEAPFFAAAVTDIDAFLREMNEGLSTTGWLAGNAFSLADIALMPYLARFDFLGLSPFWADRPALTDWYARVRARPTFKKAIIDDVAPKRMSDMVANGRALSARLVELRDAAKAV